VEEGSVGINVAATGVGVGPSVGEGAGVSGITMLVSAGITTGVGRSSIVSGAVGPQAARSSARVVKAIQFFISASFG
jgi:hypothetical protein